MSHITKERLVRLLRQAEKAHGEFEEKLGQRDRNWPEWYADFILQALHEGQPDDQAVISFEDFEKVDIRAGKVIEAEDFPEARFPSFKLKVDFGPEIGIKSSGVGAVGAHTKEELLGMLVVCVINFLPKNIGKFVSEVLTLGFKNTAGGGWVLITPAKSSVKLGDKLK